MYKVPFSEKHPLGFLVFLSPEELVTLDEYKEGDPYSLNENMTNRFNRQRINKTISLLRKITKTGVEKKILDLGCGQGHFTSIIKNELVDCDVIGLDYSLNAIISACQHYKNIEFIIADANNLPFNDEYFDIIILNNIYEHFADPVRVLQNIRKVLKKNGSIIISTPNRYRLLNLLRVTIGIPVSFFSKNHVTEYSIGQITEQLKFAKYEISEIRTSSSNIFFLRFINTIFDLYLKLIKSYNSLNSTIFYLAIKKE